MEQVEEKKAKTHRRNSYILLYTNHRAGVGSPDLDVHEADWSKELLDFWPSPLVSQHPIYFPTALGPHSISTEASPQSLLL